jgi:hypothetical protein
VLATKFLPDARRALLSHQLDVFFAMTFVPPAISLRCPCAPQPAAEIIAASAK